MSDIPAPMSPPAPARLAPIDGVSMATAQAGIKHPNRTDVLLMTFAPGTAVAGVLTRSACPSAPVVWCRERLPDGRARALLVNAGNANAFTGRKGRDTVARSVDLVAKTLGVTGTEVLLASTGVIGEPLDPAKFAGVIDDLADRLRDDGWTDAARAIMTTDTFPKLAGRSFVDPDGAQWRLNGIAKGAGMIAPDMATMLSFLATDAAVAPALMQEALSAAVAVSFNCITVDSDTSTSDTVLLFATGAAAALPIVDARDPRFVAFSDALRETCLELAHLVVRDGEGARKFITVEVEGAVSDVSAKRVALSIANSPLVKTAIAGEDANWGRVVMAVGKAGEPADRDRLAIFFNNLRVAVEGERDPAYRESDVSALMRRSEISIRVDLGLGPGRGRVWTCDLTKDYVAINGDYRS